MAVQDLIESLKSFDPNDLSDLNSIGSWKSTSHSHFKILLSAKSRTAPTAECLLSDSIIRHFSEFIHYIFDDVSWFFKKSHTPCWIT